MVERERGHREGGERGGGGGRERREREERERKNNPTVIYINKLKGNILALLSYKEIQPIYNITGCDCSNRSSTSCRMAALV